MAVLQQPFSFQSNLFFCKNHTRIIIAVFFSMDFSGKDCIFFSFKEQFPDLSCFELQALISAIMFYWFWHGYTKAFFFSSMSFLPFGSPCIYYLSLFLVLFFCFVCFLFVFFGLF